jgi:eukaryotic-like serine/threonine-protein kinase
MKALLPFLLLLLFLNQGCSLLSSIPILYDEHSDPTDWIDEKGIPMREIPAGEFVMGSSSGELDEQPAHKVWLDRYLMDKYEVTNFEYWDCVYDDKCIRQKAEDFPFIEDYGKKVSQFEDFPVIQVNWEMARTFCEWRGARLPTEAEWEKAASGASTGEGDPALYPWGNTQPTGKLANYKAPSILSLVPQPKHVGTYEEGKSIYGVYEMAGNVWEWVADWMADDYYSTLPPDVKNPTGPDHGDMKGVRGGSFASSADQLRVSVRGGSDPGRANYMLGFRCAR